LRELKAHVMVSDETRRRLRIRAAKQGVRVGDAVEFALDKLDKHECDNEKNRLEAKK